MKKNTIYPLLFIFFIIAEYLSYKNYLPTVFYGDDLVNYINHINGGFASNPFSALFDSYAEKYRPVVYFIYWGLYKLFGFQINPYIFLNFLIQAGSGIIFFRIVIILTNNRFIAFLGALLVVTSRLALFQITNVTGLLEGLGEYFFLSTIFYAIGYIQGRNNIFLKLLIFNFLLIFTHERYIGYAFVLSILILIFKRGDLKKRIKFSALMIMPVFLNIFYKVLVIRNDIFVGTGGTRINLIYSSIYEKSVEAALTLLGFNNGPEYLVGKSVSYLETPFLFIISILYLLSILALLIFYIKRTSYGQSNKAILFLTVAGLSIIVPPILTIRLEQRWLLEPQLILILILAIFAAGEKFKKYTLSIFILYSATFISIDICLNKYLSNIFFVRSQVIAENIKSNISDVSAGEVLPITFIAGNEVCNWILAGGYFFKLYGGVERKIACIADYHSLLDQEIDFSKMRIYSFVKNKPIDITKNIQKLDVNELINFDFLKNYYQGSINNKVPVETPTGSGAFILPLNTMLGKVNALIILPGFSYSYDNILIPYNSDLQFDLGVVYKTPTQPRVMIKIAQEGGASNIIYAQEPLSRTDSDVVQLDSVSIPLTSYYGKRVSIIFQVDPPLGDSSARWAAFGDPRITTNLLLK